MRRAKTDFTKNSIPQLNPPLPKKIPNQILDDVQLFEFYYKNLNIINFTEKDIKSSQDNGIKEDIR